MTRKVDGSDAATGKALSDLKHFSPLQEEKKIFVDVLMWIKGYLAYGFTVISFQEQRVILLLRQKNESVKQISDSKQDNFSYVSHGSSRLIILNKFRWLATVLQAGGNCIRTLNIPQEEYYINIPLTTHSHESHLKHWQTRPQLYFKSVAFILPKLLLHFEYCWIVAQIENMRVAFWNSCPDVCFPNFWLRITGFDFKTTRK